VSGLIRQLGGHAGRATRPLDRVASGAATFCGDRLGADHGILAGWLGPLGLRRFGVFGRGSFGGGLRDFRAGFVAAGSSSFRDHGMSLL
jgi:hypothetical protein